MPPPASDTEDWGRAAAQHCDAVLDELQDLAPWLSLPLPPPVLARFCFGFTALERVPSLQRLAVLADSVQAQLEAAQAAHAEPDAQAWLADLQAAVALSSARAQARLQRYSELAQRAAALAVAEYGFLYDATRRLLVIGYNVSEHRADSGYYDLLASEARLGIFVAIAQGALPQESWFTLGRLLAKPGHDALLLSWSGSMFEYLMPMLVMPSEANSLLAQTCQAAVAQQIAYGKACGLPWGCRNRATTP